MKTRQITIGVAVIIVALLIFQLFMRYVYLTPDRFGRVTRIDRLTGMSCYVPCTPAPPTPIPTPIPSPTPRDYDREDQEAIQKTKNSNPYFLSRLNYPSGESQSNFAWTVTGRYTNAGDKQSVYFVPTRSSPTENPLDEAVASADTQDYPVRLVCFCDSKGTGWRWEVHLDTGEVFDIDDNSELMRKYGIHRN